MPITKSTNRGYQTWIATQRIGNGTLLIESVERHTAWRELIELMAKTAKGRTQ